MLLATGNGARRFPRFGGNTAEPRFREADQRMTGKTHTIKYGLTKATPPDQITPRLRRMRRGAQRSGFSLVEVLVAIAVLTIGIIAFLEIFPGGIEALRVAASISEADRLAQGELSQLSPGNGAEIQQVAAVETIYTDTDLGSAMVQLDPAYNLDRAISPSSGLITDPTGAPNAATLSTGFNVVPTITQGTVLNPEPYEYIGGERVNIPSPTAASASDTSTASGNVMLNFGPLTLPTVSGTAYSYPNLAKFNSLDPSQHCSFFVHGLPWASQTGSSEPLTGSLNSAGSTASAAPPSIAADDPNSELKLNSPGYLIDYGRASIGLRNPSQLDINGTPTNPYNQSFVFQVSVLSGTTVMQHTFLFTAEWPNASTTGVTDGLQFYGNTTVPAGWASFAPYTDTNGNIVNGPADTTGAVLKAGDTFVPGTEKLVRDFNYVPTTSVTSSPFSDDPYEFTLPQTAFATDANGTYQIGELSFNPRASAIMDTRGQPLQASVDYIVQDWHTIHEDRTLGEQTSESQNSLSSTTVRMTLKNLLKLNASDTNGVTYNGIANVGAAGSDVLVYNLDTFARIPQGTATGEFSTDYADGAITLYGLQTGTHIRVFYHAEDNWGLAVLKPAASYTVINATANSNSDTPQNTAQAILDLGTNGSAANLYLPACDIGRSVQIGGTLVYTSASTNGGATQTVALSYLTPLSAPINGGVGAPAVIDLTKAVPGSLPTDAVFSTTTSPTVSGASITARAIWLQTRGVWRSRDVTTVDLPSGN